MIRGRRHVVFTVLALFALLVALPARSASADEGWVINTFDARITIRPDGSLVVQEALSVDFRGLKKHGIFRDIPIVYRYDGTHDRVYGLTVQSVTAANGRRHRYETSREGAFLRIKIGDPDVTLSGSQSYTITYVVEGTLNGFPDHDELYWNATGVWPVRTEAVSVSVDLPRDGLRQIACYQGPAGSREPCPGTSTAKSAEFQATRPLLEDDQLTVVVGFDKGLVAEPEPRLERRARVFEEFFEMTSVNAAGSITALIGVVGALLRAWWTSGRDRRYVTMYYLSDDPREETKPLFSRDPIVVEYEPPAKLRPAQMGVLVDEQADPLDATATIVDLAVRHHLRIREVEESRLIVFKSKDWELEKLPANDPLLPYEEKLLEGLFQDGSPIRLSGLKTKFHTYLKEAQDRLYADVQQRGFFPYRPDKAREAWGAIGVGIVVAGGGLTYLLGATFGAGLVALPIAAGGLVMLALAGHMPRRTALGREMLRRTLGFRQYIATAEKERQRYNEQANIFATYLPYAIVFRCVDKWANALEALGAAPEQYQSWYVGATQSHATDFSKSLMGLSSEVSGIIVSTPGGSGGSGFGGGSSGGGGGGGGGGSW